MFESYLGKYNEAYYKKQKEIRKGNRYLRIKKRRASDGAVGYKQFFNDMYEPYEDLKERKRYHMDKFYVLGYLPVNKHKLHHSCPLHCEKHNLKEPDPINMSQKLLKS
jgi:hypothetical protein